MARLYDVIATVRRRLASMGLIGSVEQINSDYVVIGITWESIIRFVKRRVEKTIEYPKSYIHIDEDNKLFTIHIWKGKTPELVQMLMKGGGGERSGEIMREEEK